MDNDDYVDVLPSQDLHSFLVDLKCKKGIRYLPFWGIYLGFSVERGRVSTGLFGTGEIIKLTPVTPHPEEQKRNLTGPKRNRCEKGEGEGGGSSTSETRPIWDFQHRETDQSRSSLG